jgi:hypothetical protein
VNKTLAIVVARTLVGVSASVVAWLSIDGRQGRKEKECNGSETHNDDGVGRSGANRIVSAAPMFDYSSRLVYALQHKLNEVGAKMPRAF